MPKPGRLANVVRCSATFQQNFRSKPKLVNVEVSNALQTTMETWFPGKGQAFPAVLVLRERSTEEQRVLIRGTILRVHATQVPEVIYNFQFTADPGEPVEKIYFQLTRCNIEKLIIERSSGAPAQVYGDRELIFPTPAPPSRMTMR